ncbi:hypothetical protein TrVFT333_007991 [Trichoderma virens FT-333]|nr:hypothetical protein TrVFT333_007991 [Trichoderma virens FT-333]
MVNHFVLEDIGISSNPLIESADEWVHSGKQKVNCWNFLLVQAIKSADALRNPVWILISWKVSGLRNDVYFHVGFNWWLQLVQYRSGACLTVQSRNRTFKGSRRIIE